MYVCYNKPVCTTQPLGWRGIVMVLAGVHVRSDGNLTVYNVRKDDFGAYQCIATNIVTSVITSTMLLIEYMYATKLG